LIVELNKKGYEIVVANTREKTHLVSEVDLKKFDLIYFAKFTPPQWDDVNILFNKLKRPVIYAFHSNAIIFNPFRFHNYVHNAISLIKLSYMKIAKPVSALHVLNTSEYKLLKLFGFNCYYSPLGVDTKQFKPGVKSTRFTIIFMNPRYQKGVDMLTKIVPKVLRKAPDLKFLFLVGRGSFLREYFDFLKKSFRDNVEVYEYLPQRRLRELFSSSHLLLFPSRYETFGIVVLEALSSGMPIVCYNISGAPKDVVKKYGVGTVANPFNIDEIIDGILYYYQLWKNSAGDFRRLSETCRKVALKYDWSIIASMFDNMFRTVLLQN